MKINVSHIAKLANLPLSTQEEKKFKKQLAEILDYIGKLNEVDTSGVEPVSHITGLENVVREDETLPSLSQEEALQNTKSKHNGLFRVKAILVSDA